MIDHVYNHCTEPKQVLEEIGIPPKGLKHSQLDCLVKLPVQYTCGCLHQFVKWIDEGLCDFCSLPLFLKTHLAEVDAHFIEQELKEKWEGSQGDLVSEVKQLNEVLKHCESNITKSRDDEIFIVSS